MSVPQRRRTSTAGRVKRSERRRQILAAAMHLFGGHGYANTTIALVAEAVGVSEAAVQRHFETKEALLAATLAEIRDATLGRWRAASDAAAEPVARLHAIAEAFLEAIRAGSSELRALRRLLPEATVPPVAEPVRQFYVGWEVFLAQVIAEGQQSGVFRRTLDPRLGAWELIRNALGYALTEPVGVPLYQEPDYVPRAVESLIQSLLKTDV